jgi:hypothetical protein
MINEHRHDEGALAAYIAAVFGMSASVNLYSVLLEKTGVYAERPGAFADEIGKLADYTMACLRNVSTPVESAAASHRSTI